MNPEDRDEFNTNNTVDTLTDGSADYVDTYDEKSGRSAVGRLFGDDDNKNKDAPPAKPVRTAAGDEDFLSALSGNREARGDRPRPPTVTGAPAPAARRIERTSVRNPEPKPAMRARVAVTREPVSTRRVEGGPNDTPFSDDVDSFKNRYGNRDALGTAREPGTIERNPSDDRILHPVGTKSRPRAVAAPPDRNEFQSINPIRWIALAGILVVFIVMIVLVVQNNRLSREIDELMASGPAIPPPAENGELPTPPNGYPVNDPIQYEIWRERYNEAAAELNVFRNWARDHGYNWEHILNPPAVQPTPAPTDPDPDPEPPPAAYFWHTVLPGQTLSAIARDFLGQSNLYPLIAELNELANPGDIRVGQQLRIPIL